MAKILLDYGFRIQKSIFYIRVSEHRLRELRRRIEAVIDPAVDGVKYFPLCRRCADPAFALGAAMPTAQDDDYVVI